MINFAGEESREDEKLPIAHGINGEIPYSIYYGTNLAMDIPHLATILSSTFDPNLREEAEKKLNEVRVSNLQCSFRK